MPQLRAKTNADFIIRAADLELSLIGQISNSAKIRDYLHKNHEQKMRCFRQALLVSRINRNLALIPIMIMFFHIVVLVLSLMGAEGLTKWYFGTAIMYIAYFIFRRMLMNVLDVRWVISEELVQDLVEEDQRSRQIRHIHYKNLGLSEATILAHMEFEPTLADVLPIPRVVLDNPTEIVYTRRER